MSAGDDGAQVQALIEQLALLHRTCKEALAEARDSFAWSSATEALLLAMLGDHPHPEAVLSRLLSHLDDLADIPYLTNSRTFSDAVERYRVTLEKLAAAGRS